MKQGINVAIATQKPRSSIKTRKANIQRIIVSSLLVVTLVFASAPSDDASSCCSWTADFGPKNSRTKLAPTPPIVIVRGNRRAFADQSMDRMIPAAKTSSSTNPKTVSPLVFIPSSLLILLQVTSNWRIVSRAPDSSKSLRAFSSASNTTIPVRSGSRECPSGSMRVISPPPWPVTNYVTHSSHLYDILPTLTGSNAAAAARYEQAIKAKAEKKPKASIQYPMVIAHTTPPRDIAAKKTPNAISRSPASTTSATSVRIREDCENTTNPIAAVTSTRARTFVPTSTRAMTAVAESK